ncbi:MAG: RsmB/NOP family class I SAM-dependent RNA methyltransferase, partial [Acidimicrobiales bacterium]
ALVNAVLRHLAAELEGGRPAWPDLPTELSYPDWVVARLATDLGPARALAGMKAMNEGGSSAESQRADGYRQDPASQEVAAYVGAREGELVLDICAAPGGKATWMASSGAAVVACDLSSSRAGLMVELTRELNLARVEAAVADGARPPFRPGTFDRVLVDAPCSGLGALRRRPDARWRMQPSELSRLAELQRTLLGACIPLAKEGGTVVYSVCTLAACETTEVAEWVSAEWPSLVVLAPPSEPWVPSGPGALRLPQEGGDGMFVAGWRVGAG